MYLMKRRVPLALMKEDYVANTNLPFGCSRRGVTKYELRFQNLARPDMIAAVRRYKLVFEVREAYRNAEGQSRNRIKFSVSIREKNLKNAFSRDDFWLRVDRQFFKLNLPLETELKLKDKIAEYVPQPDQHQVDTQRSKLSKKTLGW